MRIRSSGGVQSESCRHGGRASRGAPPVLLETILAEFPHHHCARIVAANDESPCKIKLKETCMTHTRVFNTSLKNNVSINFIIIVT